MRDVHGLFGRGGAGAGGSAGNGAAGHGAGHGAEKPGKASLSHNMFLALVIACTAVALAVTAASAYIYERAFLDDEHDQLAAECATLVSLLDQTDNDAELLGTLTMGSTRVTLISPDGTVTYDSSAEAGTLPNHADRPEFTQAAEKGTGSSERSSETVGYVSLYDACRLENGDVLRLSVDRAGVASFLSRDVVMLAGMAVAITVASWAVSRALANRFVRPILEIDPAASDAESPYQELDPLVSRLNDQHAQLMQRMSAIQNADDLRREFTANVTHELKTPIASISGAAELIRDGICKPDDVQEFAGRIYGDAQRLSALVSDILMLSKLDETERAGGRDALFGPNNQVDLLSVAQDVCGRLAEKARRRQVKLRIDGIPSLVQGNARLLDELVSNLVENAIRYNKPGGSVHVWVVPIAGQPTIRVRDNGIGIPEEAQQKVFERFYRVDKGRSRDMGGTGLGLAIVKHAAAFHDAQINLTSKLGEGTAITVTFP